ncbi:hypothetical protein D6C88_00286 [Aureobasidium pullulans]|nr:hypothetical protein D6C88_00286 [Aureobasidium pullulans]
MDWVGRLVERISGQSLGDYMRQHIFEPMEITSLTFHPTSGQKQNLAYMHKRNTDGTIRIHDSGHLLQGRLLDNDASAKAVIDAGGHGLFGTPKDYAQVISVLLNHGTYHKTGTQILQESTVKDMLKNQIPEHPDFARNLGYPCKPSLVNFQLETYPQASDHGQGWGLSFFSLLHPSHTGRSAGTIWWSGLANLVWWADVEKGVGGIVASQILPFFDTDVFGCHDELETAFYKHLARRKCES